MVGGFAVNFHGYVRSTGDIDVWVEASPENATKLSTAIREFGFRGPDVSEGLFVEPNRVIRMGAPPLRIEVIRRSLALLSRSVIRTA